MGYAPMGRGGRGFFFFPTPEWLIMSVLHIITQFFREIFFPEKIVNVPVRCKNDSDQIRSYIKIIFFEKHISLKWYLMF